MSTKQNKFYETLRQTQVNTFSDGLNMDLHPLTTPNTILTDCVNGTMITYNDNEFVLQNERGNTEIAGATLSDGFIPIGMKEHNGIIYIISHNPETKESEIGTFPSPMKNISKEGRVFSEQNTEYIINYSEFSSEIAYYDYNLVVSSFDKYQINNNDDENPLLILEHYILTKDGKTWSVDLKNDNEQHHFTIKSEGILGYKYRPYHIDSFNIDFVSASRGSESKLYINFSSSDQKLIEDLDDLELLCEINMSLENEQSSISYRSDKYIFDIQDLSKTFVLTGKGLKEYKWEDKPAQKYRYDYENGWIQSVYKGDIYTNIKFEVNFYINSKTDIRFKVKMDNLQQTLTKSTKEVFGGTQIFDVFNYFIKDDLLTIKADLNHRLFGKISQNDIGDAYCTLYEIDNNGNIKNNISNLKHPSPKSIPTYRIQNGISDTSFSYDLYVNENILHWKSNDNNISIQSLSKPSKEYSCFPVEFTGGTGVKYIKSDDIYDLQIWDNEDLVLSYKYTNEQICGSDIFDDRWQSAITSSDTHIYYSFDGINCDKNRAYLMDLTCEIKNEIYHFGFFVITTDKMLNNTNSKKHLLNIYDWFDIDDIKSNISWGNFQKLTNATKYIENILPLTDIEQCNNNDEIGLLVNKFFLKYNQLLSDKNHLNEVPSILCKLDYRLVFNGNVSFPFIVDEQNNQVINKLTGGNILKNNITESISLVIDDTIKTLQTTERKYLSNEFDFNTSGNIDINATEAYISGHNRGDFFLCEDFIGLNIKGSTKIFTTAYSNEAKYLKPVTNKNVNDWLNKSGTIIDEKWLIHKLRGGCKRWDHSVSNRTIHKYIEDNTLKNCISLDLMLNTESFKSIIFGNIENSENVSYSGNEVKAWIRGLNSSNKYSLVGMDINDIDDTIEMWNAIKQHAYYLSEVNRQVVQHTYKKEFLETKASNNLKMNLKFYPTFCKLINKNAIEQGLNLEMQSYNNIDISLIDYKLYNKQLDYTTNVEYQKWDKNYKKYWTFLNFLYQIINRNFISDKYLTQTISDVIQYDFTEQLYNENGNSRNINIEITPLYIDRSQKCLYIHVGNATINTFNYSGGDDCVEPLKWNYSKKFICNIGVDTIEQLNEYHSLLFYKQ